VPGSFFVLPLACNFKIYHALNGKAQGVQGNRKGGTDGDRLVRTGLLSDLVYPWGVLGGACTMPCYRTPAQV